MKLKTSIIIIFILLISISFADEGIGSKKTMITNKNEIATLGGGCFWCIEAVYDKIEGVEKVISGYAGGIKPDPSYEQVCSGNTGHAEVCQIYFDPLKITFEEILDVFWQAHDPTTVDQQGGDIGSQYRSVIFYKDQQQQQAAEKSILQAGKIYQNPLVTEVKELDVFYEAEEYHQDYFAKNPNVPYCVFVIQPKLDKLKDLEHLKD